MSDIIYKSRDPNSGREPVYCCSGNPKRDKFRLVKPDHSEPYLDKVGEFDQQAFINSFKEQCDVDMLVKRYEAGDASALARVQGVYCDLRDYPDNITDAHNILNDARRLFDSLSDEDRARFGTFENYLSFGGVLPADPGQPAEPTLADVENSITD